MPFELLGWQLNLPLFALVASRLAGMIMLQPVFGTLSVPLRVRTMLVLALAALVAPLTTLSPNAPGSLWLLAPACAQELLIGFLLGFVMRLCFVGLQVGGTLIAQESGLAFGQIVDPTTDHEQDALSTLYMQLAAVVFLVVGGHRAVLAAALDTFATIPLLGAWAELPAIGELLLETLNVGMKLGLAVAAPLAITMLLVNAVLGFLSRSMPQLNVLTVGFSIKTLVTFAVMAVGLPTAVGAFVNCADEVHGWIERLAP